MPPVTSLAPRRLVVALSMASIAWPAWASAGDTLKVTNHTPSDVFVAVYYVDGESDDAVPGNAERAGPAIRIPAKKAAKVARPSKRCGIGGRIGPICVRYGNRDLYLARSAAELATQVTKGTLPFVNVGKIHGAAYHISDDGDELDGHNFLSWGLRKVGMLFAAKYRKELAADPVAKKPARVRLGNALSGEEQRYVAMRAPKVKAAMEKLLGQKLSDKEVPRLAFVASGGGYRAMISTLGYLQGASNLGVLDAAMYSAGLSGSTWAVAGWLQSGKSVGDYLTSFTPAAQHGLRRNVDMRPIIDLVLRRLALDEPRSIIDIWGSIIAQRVLGSKGGLTPSRLDLGAHAARLAQADAPYPIYTAVIDGPVYDWVEFTPHEVGSVKMGAHVPAWAFGRRFKGGHSRTNAPAQPLAFGLGTWGSAISGNIRDLLAMLETSLKGALTKRFGAVGGKFFEWLFKKITGTSASRLRFLPPRVHNWARGLKGVYENAARLTLVDAGVDFNLPFPPVLGARRGVDVIITLDASAGANVGDDLKSAAKWAKREGMAFPSLEGAKLDLECSLHHDARDPKAPLIVYLPVLLKEKFMGTSNFRYTAAQVKQLTDWTAGAITRCRGLIVQALRSAADRRR